MKKLQNKYFANLLLLSSFPIIKAIFINIYFYIARNEIFGDILRNGFLDRLIFGYEFIGFLY